MSSQQQKGQNQSLSSLSINLNQIGLGISNIFSGRKSSFDYVNILKDSDQLSHRDFRNSLDILTSNINTIKPTPIHIKQIIEIYNQQNKIKIQQFGYKPLEIGEVYSESEGQERKKKNNNYHNNNNNNYHNNNNNNNNNITTTRIKNEFQIQNPIKLQTVYNESKFNYHQYFPHDLAQVLKQRQIPLQYVKGLLMVRDQKQIKTTRQLKVQRYLQKRRKKTWSRKICYNCRQKVAQERLRIKGKFIKKRRAMEILGLTIPIQTSLLKQKLYEVMKNKNHVEIDELLKMKAKKQKNSDNEINSQSEIDEDDEQDQSNEEDSIRQECQQNNDNFVK